MRLEATLDATVDDTVEFVFHVVNTGTGPVELTFRSGQVTDVAVYDADTEELVWRWSDDKLFPQAIETKTVPPDQAFEQVYTWDDPSPGTYTVVGTLESDQEVEAQTSITV